MIGFIGGLVLVVSAYLAGRALLPARAQMARSCYEELCTSILLGLGALQVAGMATVFVFGTFTLAAAISLSLAAAACGIWRIREQASSPVEPCAFAPLLRLLILTLGVGSVAMTLAWPLNEFDPILHFGLKGKLLFAGESIRGEAFTALSGDFGRIMTHPNYPLGIPLLEAWSAHFGGGWSDRWVQFPLAFWSLCLPGAVAFGMRRFGSTIARNSALVAACTPILYVMSFLHNGGQDFAQAGLGAEKMLGGRGDLPVAAFISLTAAMLLRGGSRGIYLSGLGLAAAMLSKNEGLAMTCVFAIAVVVALLLSRCCGSDQSENHWWKQAFGALVVGLLLASPWLIHRASLPSIDENYTESLSIENLSHFLSEDETADSSPINPKLYGAEWSEYSHWRPARIGRYFWEVFSDVLSWGLLWLLFALGLLRAFGSHYGRILALWVVGGLALYAVILLVTPWFLIALHQKGIPARLILHLLGPAAMVAAWPAKAKTSHQH